jgi:hypothetical protein
MLEAHFEAPLAVSNYLNPLVQKGAKNTIAITNKRFLEGKLHLPLDPNEQRPSPPSSKPRAANWTPSTAKSPPSRAKNAA